MSFHTICDEEDCPRPVFGESRYCPPHREHNDTAPYGRCQAEECEEVLMPHEDHCPDHNDAYPSSTREVVDDEYIVTNAGQRQKRPSEED